MQRLAAALLLLVVAVVDVVGAPYTRAVAGSSAQHTWDVRVAADPEAGIPEDVARVLAEHLADGLSFLIGFIGRADAPRRLLLSTSGTRDSPSSSTRRSA